MQHPLVQACSQEEHAHVMYGWWVATDLPEGSRVEKEGAAVREHHLHVLLNAGEASALHTHQEVAHLAHHNPFSSGHVLASIHY